jgi:hypothetical protein
MLEHEFGQEVAEDDGKDPSAEKAFQSLLRRQLDELGSAKGNTTQIGEYVIGDDESGGKEEPDHALEDVVDDEVGLNHNEVKGHMGPSELGELMSVMAFL